MCDSLKYQMTRYVTSILWCVVSKYRLGGEVFSAPAPDPQRRREGGRVVLVVGRKITTPSFPACVGGGPPQGRDTPGSTPEDLLSRSCPHNNSHLKPYTSLYPSFSTLIIFFSLLSLLFAILPPLKSVSFTLAFTIFHLHLLGFPLARLLGSLVIRTRHSWPRPHMSPLALI